MPADSDNDSDVNIVVTQPRRVAATALAQRVAREMKSPPPGQPDSLVGHHVQLDRAVWDDTARIVYCTVGILVRRLVFAMGGHTEYTHIVIDEVHERDVQTDFLLALIRGTVLPRNPNLRIVIMSATASADLFVDYFDPYKPKVLTIPGRTFPVETKWITDCQQMLKKEVKHYHDTTTPATTNNGTVQSSGTSSANVTLSPRAMDPIDNVFIEHLIAYIIRRQQANGEDHLRTSNSKQRNNGGAILVFLPGKGEIEALFRILTTKHSVLTQIRKEDCKIDIHRLYSGVSWQVQQAVFEPAGAKSIKVILSTNVAETSITIPDVSHVIDTGLVKESRFNAERRIHELVTVWTSQASTLQRSGRAGRTMAGVCYRLYSQRLWQECMLPYTPPEMIRTPLDDLIIQL